MPEDAVGDHGGSACVRVGTGGIPEPVGESPDRSTRRCSESATRGGVRAMKTLLDFQGRPVRLTDERGQHILEHPEMAGMESALA